MSRGITTFRRFNYLNIYAYLLLLGAIGIVSFPAWRWSVWTLVPQGICALYFMSCAYRIFSTWDDKKRKYNILMERNKKELRRDTFYEFMQAPCGRLLVRVVLTDLGHIEYYSTLKKLRLPLWKQIQRNRKPKKTKVFINPLYKEQNGSEES